jgi:hypothetical protein
LRIASDAAAAAPRRGLAGMQLLLETREGSRNKVSCKGIKD